jgi:hypothetical protein
MTFPWEQLPAVVSEPSLPAPLENTVAAMQRDLAYMVGRTAILVHSNRPELQMLVNTARGQLIPRGECTFTDGSTVEFQDIGMPQIGADEMTVTDLMARVWDLASQLGLELRT